MGYSCTYEANITLQAIQDSFGMGTLNMWRDDDGKEYFFEIGRENIDGSITGTVFDMKGKRYGGFKIAPNGKLINFPHLPKKIRDHIKQVR